MVTACDGRVLYEVIKIIAAKYLLVTTGLMTKAAVGGIIGDIALGRAHHQNLGLYRFRGIAERHFWVEFDMIA